MINKKVLISIVTYHSDLNVLKEVLSKLHFKKNIYISLFDNSKSNKIKKLACKLSIDYNQSKNIGFGKGHNKNISLFFKKNITVDYILILNPDLFISTGNIADLIVNLENYPNSVIVSPLLINVDGSVQNFIRIMPTFKDFIARIFGLNQYSYAANLHKVLSVPFAHGACYLISADNYLKFGGYDERYFLYCEDLDLCRRIYESGNNVLVDPNVHVIHNFNRLSRKSFKIFFIHLFSIVKFLNQWGWVQSSSCATKVNLYFLSFFKNK